MFKEIKDICPSCGAEELRPVQLGNDRDGWQFTGDFECDSCGGTFSPFVNEDRINYETQEVNELNNKEIYAS